MTVAADRSQKRPSRTHRRFGAVGRWFVVARRWRIAQWWHKSLAIQLLASMLLAFFASQAISLVISWDGYKSAVQTAVRTELHSRAAAVARLVEVAPPELKGDLARVSSTDYSRFWISDGATPDLDGWLDEAFARFRVPLHDLFGIRVENTPVGAPGVKTILSPEATVAKFLQGARWSTPAAGGAEGADFPARARYVDYADMDGAGVLVPLSDGRTLNVAFYKHLAPSIWATPLPLTVALTAGLVALVGAFTARRIARPLRQLTTAAESLGRGEAGPPLCETGPDDIRRTAEAFNRMQERLHRFVEDRTRMLAAISHDLRTPLTTLRLRAELVEDQNLQGRMLSTIDEMQAMADATLALIRQETTAEATRTIDLCALIGSTCEDLAELGYDVTFEACDRLPYRCRPDGLRRAVRNLVENAARYAGKAHVRLVAARTSVEIVVDDDGPGIPADKLDEVFAPFYRLEGSRSRETGGAGLGLSIARAIARQHGGDITLRPRSPGLSAAVTLPV
ncbi:ATP-binding protein [Aureimonas sp. AU22]|uniref:ATP-binding protein n=1 Tax=Aureimonas sp. AU22 TaxID=1638162 RepID=UPI0009EC1011|nr:ATP-binding protein [Aureimonas sp. AU22]